MQIMTSYTTAVYAAIMDRSPDTVMVSDRPLVLSNVTKQYLLRLTKQQQQ